MGKHLVVVVVVLALATGCGGSATANGQEAGREQPQGGTGTGGSANHGPASGSSNQAMGGTTGSAQGGQGGTSPGGQHVGGTCSKLCVPTATFVASSPVSAEELRSGHLEACRNGDAECFEGVVPAASGENTVWFGGSPGWRGPMAFSEDDWQTLHFSWYGVGATPPLGNGDRFTLRVVGEEQSITILDRVVDFESVVDCAGPCLRAFFDLRGEPGGAAGAGGEGNESGAGGAR